MKFTQRQTKRFLFSSHSWTIASSASDKRLEKTFFSFCWGWRAFSQITCHVTVVFQNLSPIIQHVSAPEFPSEAFRIVDEALPLSIRLFQVHFTLSRVLDGNKRLDKASSSNLEFQKLLILRRQASRAYVTSYANRFVNVTSRLGTNFGKIWKYILEKNLLRLNRVDRPIWKLDAYLLKFSKMIRYRPDYTSLESALHSTEINLFLFKFIYCQIRLLLCHTVTSVPFRYARNNLNCILK